MVIGLVANVSYSIGGYWFGGYCQLFYWWLLVPILLVAIGLMASVGYTIGGYWFNGQCWLYYWWLLV